MKTTDPGPEVDDERLERENEPSTLSDPAVREARRLLVGPRFHQAHIYGRTASRRPNFPISTRASARPTTGWGSTCRRRNQVLDAAGGKARAATNPGEGRQDVKYVYPNLDQRAAAKVQALGRGVPGKAGIDLELKSVSASVYFRPMSATDTFRKVLRRHADVQHDDVQPDPEDLLGRSARGKWRQGQQAVRPQQHPLAQRRNRQGVRPAPKASSTGKRAALFTG